MNFHPRALAQHDRLWNGHLNEIELSDLAAPLLSNGMSLSNTELRTLFAETVNDLAALLDEIRFSGTLAALLVADYSVTTQKAQQPADDTADLKATAIPLEAMAILRPHFAHLPEPVALFESMHENMTGNRVLSLWFAGQLLDTALFRVVAALDRLAVLLHTCAGKPPHVAKSGIRHLPAFRPKDLEAVKDSYPAQPWRDLSSLTAHPIFELLMQVRNGFTHWRRVHSQLHGHFRVVYGLGDLTGGVTVEEGIDGGTHLSILLAAYNEILRPAVIATRACLTSSAGTGTL